jgi:hypothetical protein
MWNPFTGYLEQYYPASVGGRALKYNNQDGATHIQVEVFFTPGCVVDGVKYDTVAETPCIGLDVLLDWMDGFGIPRVWPMGAPQWSGNSRDVGIWNGNAGHYGHCNSPGDDHTDPGPMPSLNRGIAAQGTITPQEDTMTPEQWKFVQTVLSSLSDNVATKTDVYDLKVWTQGVGNNTGDRVINDQRAQAAAIPAAVLNAQFKLADGTVTNLAGILTAIHAQPVTGGAVVSADPSAVVKALAAQLNK